jgi:hypothetical protein
MHQVVKNMKCLVNSSLKSKELIEAYLKIFTSSLLVGLLGDLIVLWVATKVFSSNSIVRFQ